MNIDPKTYFEKILYEALVSLCGGTIEWHPTLSQLAKSAISMTPAEKFYDIEIRAAPAVFHRFKKSGILAVQSDLGLERTVRSPSELAGLLLLRIEEACRYDCRCNESGFICITSPQRMEDLRMMGLLPCPYCIQWCRGEKGLWWHTQQKHCTEHSHAMAAAVATRAVNALVVYSQNDSRRLHFPPYATTIKDTREGCDTDPFEQVKRGDLKGIQQSIELNGFNPRHTLDAKGASVLLWAAGGGHINVVKYLVHDCRCDPSFAQRGKRAFAGRTALHWAARNGHLSVVEFLVEVCNVDIEAKTGDGTTPFCWAAWQAHQDILEYLNSKGANVSAINSFGCNAALWAAQGEATCKTLEWLQQVGCHVDQLNYNGHGVLHKAAQRGKRELCEWFLNILFSTIPIPLDLIQPDGEGCIPSDLAGIEDHISLAEYLAEQERRFVLEAAKSSNFDHPKWLPINGMLYHSDSVWEANGGIRRLQAALCSL